jgi:2-polyprenyl-3-methyl-5-hydroxy-6-metoxy-1,4-benzoquinol methylase
MGKSERFWDRAASSYDREEKKDDPVIIQIEEKTRKYLKKSDVVLDYGCGTGTIDIAIAGEVKEIHGIDTSQKMIEFAIRKSATHNISNINYEQASIFDERLKQGSFDVITASNILDLVDDPLLAVKRIHDLLKPDGVFISATPYPGEVMVLKLILPIASKIGLVPKVNAFKYPEIEKLITGGGFQIIESISTYRGKPIWFIAARKT